MKRPGSRALTLAILSIVALISISSASILIKATTSPPSIVSFWRLFISVLILLFYSIITNRLGLIARSMERNLLLTVLSGFFLAIHFYSWIWSLRLLPVIVSTTLVDLHPVFTGILSHAILKERLEKKQWVLIIISLSGGLLASYREPSSLAGEWVLGSILSIIGALAASGYFVIGRIVRKSAGLYEYVIPTYLWSSVFLAVISILEGRYNLLTTDLREFALFVAIAIGPMIGGHTVLNYMLRYVEAPIVSTIAVLEPVGAGILAYIFLGELVEPINILGISLAVSGIVILGITLLNRSQQA
jgi:drug/metabolite transporter (DMT)-like permease